jgi:peptide/nickel transport system substrate-binding protein
VEAAILGPLEVRIDGKVVPLGGPKQRALLAMLVLHANEVVSRDRLIDALWGERPPPSVDQSLDSYVSRLRRALGRDRLVRRSGGYVLSIGPGERDLDRFETLVAEARAASARGEEGAAVGLLQRALDVWRGPAFADLLYEPFAGAEAERLEELRLGAVEALMEARLATGAGAELVPELERLVREYPLRERLLGQLMLALYRAGRQVEALDSLRAARRRLAGELGLEPGPQLRELERRILRQDPGLDAQRPPARAASRLRWRTSAGLAAVVLVAAATTGLILATGDTSEVGAEHQESRLVSIGGPAPEHTAAIELPGPPATVTAGAGSVWVADASGETITRIDASSGGIVDRIPVRGGPGSLVSGAGALWLASSLDGSIKRIDAATGAVTQTVHVGGGNASAIAFGAGRLWVADATDHALVEVDPTSGTVRRTVTLDVRPTAVVAGRRAIWAAGYESATVEEIDPRSGRTIATVAVGNGPSALAAGRGAVWVANSLDSTISRIDTRTRSVTNTIPVGSGPSALALDGESVWVANAYSGTVSRIDLQRNVVEATHHVGGRPTSIAASKDRVWVGSAPRSDAHRGGTLRIVTTQPFASIDPAFVEFSSGFQFTRLAYDSLVTFEAAPGARGLRLVPDLAVALPVSTAGGTRYSFRLRPGIRYSDGRPLRAGDFRRGIERLFRVGSNGADYYTGVVGAGACRRHPVRCNLSRGIVTDERARTVVFRLRSPDPDFLFKMTVGAYSAPIPRGTPDRDVEFRHVPGTGPYRVAAASGREIRFVRSRFFREWSHAAQPDGNPDGIVWRLARSPESAVRTVLTSQADWFFGLIPPTRLGELAIRRPAQMHQNSTFAVDFIPLNTSRPPFDDVRVRQALNYAIDRRKIVRLYGGPVAATPICQPLAPGMPGYRRYCPYTAPPRRDGGWAAPDLARARRLVAVSGTRGSRIDVWAATDLPYIPRRLPAYVASVLRSLGYRTRLRLIPYEAFSPPMRRRIALSVDGDWVPEYPSPSAYMPQFFGCHGRHNRKRYVCDPHLDKQMAQASALQISDRPRAADSWTRIDRELVDRAVWVPTVNPHPPELVSKRLRNYQFHPVWGFIASQVWLR